MRSASISRHIEREPKATANQLATSEAHYQESLKKLNDEHSAVVLKLREEIKRLEPFEFRAKVLEEEVTKSMADLRVSERKPADAEQKEKEAKIALIEAEDLLK